VRALRFLTALIAALACAALPAAASAQGGGTLTIGISQFASTLHPNMEASVAKSYVLAMARRPITVHDADWELVCMLCTELPTLENGLAVLEETPDGGEGIAVTYQLHPDATWGDGTPVTAADVVFTWEVGRHPQSAYDNIELYRSIRAIDVIDDKTVVLHRDRVHHDYNAVNDLRLLPAHLERPVFEADPVGYPDRTLYNTEPTEPGLYFGPYRITEVESGAFMVLEPNETWYGPAPQFDRIVVRTIENTAAMEANLLSGSIDMIAGELGLTLDQALAFEQRHGDAYQVLYQPALIYEHIDLNLDNPLLADPRVRRALLYAIDRQTMTERLFQSRQPVAVTNVSPLDWVFAEDVRRYPYDPERAAALLDAAGFSEIRDGVRHDADGRRLAFTLMTTAGNRTRELVAQVLQSQWREAGIAVTINNQPARVFFGGTVSERRFEAMAMFAWVAAPENVPRTTLHSDHIPTPENNWSGQNYTGFTNAAMDTLIEAAEVELDRDRRAELWRWMQRIYAEELPALPLYYRANAYILPQWLEGVRPTGHQYGTTLWVEEWRRAE
jgi:peptide/nickel transport system substrate-binding protein